VARGKQEITNPDLIVEVVKLVNGEFIKKRQMKYIDALKYKSRGSTQFKIYQVGFSQYQNK